MLEQYYEAVNLLEKRIKELETSLCCTLSDKKQRLELLREEVNDMYYVINYLEGRSPLVLPGYDNVSPINCLHFLRNKYCSKTQ